MLRLITLLIVTVASTANPTAAPISIPPNPGYEFCSICGLGNVVVDGGRLLQFPVFPELSCEALQQAGEDGYIEPTLCQSMTGLISGPCGCQVAPTAAPVTASDSTTTTTSVAIGAGILVGAQLLM